MRKLNISSYTDKENQLKYQFGYTNEEISCLRKEAQSSIFSYEDILTMEINSLKAREQKNGNS